MLTQHSSCLLLTIAAILLIELPQIIAAYITLIDKIIVSFSTEMFTYFDWVMNGLQIWS
ncbi:MAG: hypothetical protein F6J87_02630 [Spirulina sp. SIO3F2]|nr:hypothetical protein [Spirulina sp. SIO3F2]